MKRDFYSENYFDAYANPEGGVAFGEGFTITWQRGPLGRGDDRIEPNGAFVETVIAAVRDRLYFYQDSKFACRENQMALEHMNAALIALDGRAKDREAQGIEGTHGKRESEYDGRDLPSEGDAA